MTKNLKNSWPTFFVSFLVLVALAWVGCLFFLFDTFIAPDIRYQAETKARQIPFDSSLWKSTTWETASRGENRTRDYMLGDLLHRYNFKGWYRAMVVDLLGEPNDERANFVSDGLTYNWYRIDGAFDYLLFRYDTKGQVVDYLVSHD